MDVREAILDSAERHIRIGGYHGFSFREVAADVGVKSASVHYYFPVKSDLARETARRYTARFFANLGAPDGPETPQVKLQRMIDLFRDAMEGHGRMCLCGVLCLEISSLPADVAKETAAFFQETLDWLRVAMGHWIDPAEVLAVLEGALILARSQNNAQIFDLAVASLERKAAQTH